jgi:dipeptidyl aminopeptidase/acylaminoacyl peptidase
MRSSQSRAACYSMTAQQRTIKQRTITVEDLWTLRRVGAPSVSPDGEYASAAVTHYDMASNEGRSQIWIFRTRGGAAKHAARALTRGDKDSEPQWSPDGKWIAFVARRSGDEVPQVYLIAPGGGEARRLTDLSTGVAALRWFADGKRIAFISWVWPDLKNDKAQGRRLRGQVDDKVKARSSERVTYRHWDHWLTDGRVPHVFAADVMTGRTRDLLAGTGVSLQWLDPGVQTYDISPDGKELALTADLDPEPKWGNDFDIVTLDIGSGRKSPKWKNLTGKSRRCNSEPRYSPDGKWLVYLSSDLKRSPDDQPKLMLRARVGGRTRMLAPAWDRSPGSLAWTPDSAGIVFTAEDRAQRPLWSLRLDAKFPSRIVGEGSIDGFALSRDGTRVVFNRSTASRPPALFACDRDGGDPRAIESLNGTLLARLHMGEVRELTFKGWGGETVQMWLTYPPNLDRRKKWPLLHLIHGGPHNAWLDTFHSRWNSQLFAAQGYIVAGVNYHGSTGWGRKFLESNNGRYGVKEIADIEAATDCLLGEGIVDGRRLFAAGGSYGGYLAAYMNGHTRRYRAYVCHAGCYDWVSMMATDAYMHLKHELGAYHWDDPARVLKQSAHHYAGAFQTPTLVTHGELDYRVPVTQALQYYATLKARKVPARLLVFPDENHWILKPQNARLWTMEFLSWLRRHDPGASKRPSTQS